MPRTIVTAPGAEENPLAGWLSEALRRSRLRGNREAALSPRGLDVIRASVGFVAVDRRLAATVRFDRGAVVVHDGTVGVPDITFCGRFEALTALASLSLDAWWRPSRSRNWMTTITSIVSDDLKIYGLVTHPRLVVRVLRALSLPAP